MQDTKALPITSPVTLSDLEALGGSSIPAPLLRLLPASLSLKPPSFYFPFFVFPLSCLPPLPPLLSPFLPLPTFFSKSFTLTN